MRGYGISSKTVRIGYETPRGYDFEQFIDVFERYLPSQSSTPLLSKTMPQPNNHKTSNVSDDVADNYAKCNNETNVALRENVAATQNPSATPKPLPALDCDVVADKTPLTQKCVRI